jgi:photosystem II stability/assembly factor-like uncharacterized protein
LTAAKSRYERPQLFGFLRHRLGVTVFLPAIVWRDSDFMKKILIVVALSLLVWCVAPGAPAPQGWQVQAVNTAASFRGLSVVDQTVWASGTSGTFVKTTDSGKTWRVGQVAGAEKLDFRDVEAFSAQVAYLLSIGPGENSRIYKTTNGGDIWTLQFQNTEKEAFFDALAFWDDRHGLAMSDPVRGRFYLVKTDDGGAHWTPVAPAGMPPAVTGEGGFAASGTCLVTRGKTEAFLVSGGTAARVYHSKDRGQTWTVVDTPVIKGAAGAGIFSLAFADEKHGVIVGGNYEKPEAVEKNAAVTADGGHTWQLPTIKRPTGFRSGVAFDPTRRRHTVLAVGTSGTDVSRDGGQTWTNLDKENLNAVAFDPSGVAWAVGPNGRVVRMAVVAD